MVRSDLRNWSARMTQVHIAEGWYIDAGGRVEGPFTVGDLGERATSGELAPTDSVSADRVTWVPANTVPGLKFPARPRQPLMETVVSGSVYPVTPTADPGPETVPVVSVAGYTILDTLGSGACGVVYKARQEKLSRVVALKTVLMPEKASHDLVVRFEQEAVSLARLQHPNIVAIYDSGMCASPNGQAFFAMELLEGEDLGARIDRTGPLSERVAWNVIRQSAAALAHAAAIGIVHRDIKPANLFLVPPPTGFQLPEGVPMVKVTDFGLALSRTEGDTRRSAAGTLLGTPVYMAPEQFAGSDVDVRADIYGLGCTIYHALTGQPPFDGRTVWDVMMKKGTPAPRLAPPISPETADLVASMLAIDPAGRPGDYTELLAKIDALPCMDPGLCSVRLTVPSLQLPTVNPPEPVRDVPAPVSHRRRLWLYGLAAVVLFGAGVAVASLFGAFNQKAGNSADPPEEESELEVNYIAGPPIHLYTPGSLEGWQGRGWSIEKNDAKELVLAGTGTAMRKFTPPRSPFRMTMHVDRENARSLDLVIATEGSRALVVRAERTSGTATFGKRSETGAFEAIGTAAPLPTAEELRVSGPYVPITYIRTGNTLTVWFNNRKLGRTSAAGLTTTELRIDSTGPIRITTADLAELTEQK